MENFVFYAVISLHFVLEEVCSQTTASILGYPLTAGVY